MSAVPAERITRYAVSCVPEEHPDSYSFTITVEYRGQGTWAVCWPGCGCWGTDGDWDYEPIPSSREDGWLERHRFTEDEALRIAHCLAPGLKIGRYTVDDILEGRWHE